MITDFVQVVQAISALNDIETFNLLGGHLSRPNDEGLNYDLLREELDEYKIACEQGNEIKKADALGDMMVVLWGIILKEGKGDIFFNKILHPINQSNLSKFCNNEADAALSVQRYAEKGVKSHYREVVTGWWAIINSDTGKILKGVNYKEPIIKP
jgi:hypothetical protein